MSDPLLVVLGALNVDLVVRGFPLPGPGETVVGGAFERHHGGKGGNQAVAAARALRGGRADGSVRLLGAVGDDEMGVDALETLRAEGVDVSHVSTTPDAATGVALIVVDEAGENQIAVAPGANAAIGSNHVDAALEGFARSGVVLASLEVPVDVVRAAAVRCRALGGTFVLNPAPATKETAVLLPLADVVTPNEGELRLLGGDAPSVRAAYPDLRVVCTRGIRGAEIDGVTPIPAPDVRAVDTTGAGDCLNGVLAAGLLEGRSLEDAVRRAVFAATISVRRPGARGGMPNRDEIDGALGA